MTRLPRTNGTTCTTEIENAQKNREENQLSSRVEVRGCDPEGIRGRYQALGLVPLFLRFFLCCFLSLCQRLFPHFNQQRAEVGEELGIISLHLTAFSNRQIFLVKHFSREFKNIFTRSCAIFFFGARKSFSFSPLRSPSPAMAPR